MASSKVMFLYPPVVSASAISCSCDLSTVTGVPFLLVPSKVFFLMTFCTDLPSTTLSLQLIIMVCTTFSNCLTFPGQLYSLSSSIASMVNFLSSIYLSLYFLANIFTKGSISSVRILSGKISISQILSL